MNSTAKTLIGGTATGRQLHVIDLETLARASVATTSYRGRAWPSDQKLRKTWAAYQQAIDIQQGDHVLLGLRSGRCGRLADLLAASGTQLRVAPDARGVRAALVDSVDVRHAARRFDWLVIAGWGEELAELAVAARSSGLWVSRVSGTIPPASALGAPRRHRSGRPPRNAAVAA